MIGDKDRPLSFDEAHNIAKAIVEHDRHKYWFSEDIQPRLAAAAWGHPPEQAADELELMLLAERRVPLNDDPHDAFDPRLVARQASATVSVPAPVSDPNTERSSNLSVRNNHDYIVSPNT